MTTQTRTDAREQSVRTFIAAFVAVLLTRIAAAIPVIADAFAYVDKLFVDMGYPGITALGLVEAVIVAAAILLYQKVVQWLGDRWPRIEAILLGSAARPHYEPRGLDGAR